MKYIKTYESNITSLDIEDLFIELYDINFKVKFYTQNVKDGIYYFLYLKEYKDEFIETHLKNGYGFSDVSGIKSEISNILTICEEVNQRLEKMGYVINFQFQFMITDDDDGPYSEVLCRVNKKHLGERSNINWI